MIEKRIKIAAIIVAAVAVVLTVFFVFFASYDFSNKAWNVKRDPIHGFSYTMYSKQEFGHARIVIRSCSKKSGSVKVPDTIWGVRVEELGDSAFAEGVDSIALGKYVYLVGEGYGSKKLTLPADYAQDSHYLAIKDKNASGFYYKAMKDGTLTAFAYFGSEENYQIPVSCAGISVSKATEYYVNDDYLTLMANTIAEHASALPYNMVRLKQVQKDAIDPYIYYLEDLESREKMKGRLMALPDEYNFNPDGSPADGETAIKMALLNKGDGNGKNCAMVLAEYPAIDFIQAERFLSRRTSDCHTDGELDFGDWLLDGFIEVSA